MPQKGASIAAQNMRKLFYENDLNHERERPRCIHSVTEKRFATGRIGSREVVVDFDGGRISSDAGALLLAGC